MPTTGLPGAASPRAVRCVVPPVAVRVRRAQLPFGKNRAGRELERPRVAEASRADGVAEELLDVPAAVDDDDCVPLVRVHPQVAAAVESDAVGAVEGRMLDEECVQAERVGRERRVAAGRRAEIAPPVQLDSPHGAARRVRDVEVAVPVECQPVRDDPLRRGRKARRKRLVLPADADRVRHRRDPEEHGCGASRTTDAEHAPLGGAAVGDVQVPVLVERDPVGARRAGGEAGRDRRACGIRTRSV